MVKGLKQFIFITTEGDTIAPNSDYPIENCQVLGIVEALSPESARKILIYENPWIEQSGFDIMQARCIQVVTDNLRNNVLKL